MVRGSIGERVLVVGDYMWPWYQEACAAALEKHGCMVERFGWFDDFFYFDDGKAEPQYRSWWDRFQYRFQFGPKLWSINKRLITTTQKFQPEIIWFYNVTLISPSTVKKIRKICGSAVMVQYANDNPFSKKARRGLWRNFKASIQYFDMHYVFRLSNIQDYRKFGAKTIGLLRSYFLPYEDFPTLHSSIPERFRCDVVFAGHYEDDGRVEMLEEICSAGYKLKLYGGGWAKAYLKLKPNSSLRPLFPIEPATGSDYRYAICGAKVALCFLSTLNQDTYTTRNFQIPAMRVVMLSQYTEDLAAMFAPDVEAVFFRDKTELLKKLNILMNDELMRSNIASAGYARVNADGHDVFARMSYMLKNIRDFIGSQSFAKLD